MYVRLSNSPCSVCVYVHECAYECVGVSVSVCLCVCYSNLLVSVIFDGSWAAAILCFSLESPEVWNWFFLLTHAYTKRHTLRRKHMKVNTKDTHWHINTKTHTHILYNYTFVSAHTNIYCQFKHWWAMTVRQGCVCVCVWACLCMCQRLRRWPLTLQTPGYWKLKT